jgi:hypothetical protein
MSKPFPLPIAMFLPEARISKMRHYGDLFTRWAINLSMTGALLACACAAYIFFWPIPTIRYNHLPLPVAAGPIRPGEALPLTVDYCKYVAMPERVVGQIVTDDADRVVLAMGGLDRNLEPGCHVIKTRIWHVPADTQPGRYRAEFTLTYLLFNIRTVTAHSYSQPFTVAN